MPHTARAASLLATVGLRDSTGLWSLSQNRDGDHISRAAGMLALTCATAIDTLEEAERSAASTAASLHGFASDEIRAGNAGGQRDAAFIAAAAASYAKYCGRIDDAAAQFRAAAAPLAALLGLLGLDALSPTTTAAR